MECLVCGDERHETFFDQDIRKLPLRFVKCRNCSLVFQSPRLTRECSERYFDSQIFQKDCESIDFDLKSPLGYPDYADWDKSYQETAFLRLKRIRQFRKAPGRLLEIGPATGAFLACARNAGYEVSGLDASSSLADVARKRHDLEIETAFIEESDLPEAFYDIICAFGGISCWRDPVKALKKINRALKPDGILTINYPDLNAFVPRVMGKRYFEFNPASFTIFSRTTLRRCLEGVGLEPLFSQSERQVASLGRVFSYLKAEKLERITRHFKINAFQIPVIVSGTVFEICGKKSANG